MCVRDRVPPPLHQSICTLCAGLREGGGVSEGRKAVVSIHVMAPFIGGRWIYRSHFFILPLLTFQVRLQGTVGETPSRDPRYQMVFRQWVSTRTGAHADAAATSLRNAEDDILRQLLNALRRLLVLPGAGGGSSSRQRLWGLRCPGPSVPPPAGLPVCPPSGCGFVPALRLLLTVAGQ